MGFSFDIEESLEELDVGIDFSQVVNGDTLKAREVKEDSGVRTYNSLGVKDLLPKQGLHLGLDISKNSTGIALVGSGSYDTVSLPLNYDSSSEFAEVLGRRTLKSLLEGLYSGYHFDTVVVEDVFVGENASTARLLYSLNTAIDELILDGIITCSAFVRVNNQTWKSWLWGIESQVGKGLDDKERTRLVMEYLGVSESGSGYQDRLDALGMLVGYFYKVMDMSSLPVVESLRWNQLDMVVVRGTEDLGTVPTNYSSLPVEVVSLGSKLLTKELVKYYLGLHSGRLVVFESVKNLPIIAREWGLTYTGVGTLAVWRKKK